jgi:hypothetical protein
MAKIPRKPISQPQARQAVLPEQAPEATRSRADAHYDAIATTDGEPLAAIKSTPPSPMEQFPAVVAANTQASVRGDCVTIYFNNADDLALLRGLVVKHPRLSMSSVISELLHAMVEAYNRQGPEERATRAINIVTTIRI